jgi:hypothetical protein
MEGEGGANRKAPTARRVIQFYGRHIKIGIVSLVLFGTLWALASGSLLSISQNGFGILASMFATLLGLTFAAFSVLTGMMPSIPKSLIRTRTFLVFGQTFVATMWVQLLTVLVAGACYIAFGQSWVGRAGALAILLGILSTGLLLFVVHYMLFMFKLVRKELGGEGTPESVF